MAIPIYATVLSQINTYIVANGNNEITANVLNPILVLLLDFANNNIGDLDTLTTDEKNSIVEAINSLKQNFDDLVNNGVQLYTGIDDPNDVSPPSYKYADFYMQLDIDSLPVKLWQWNGFVWTDASQEPATESDNVNNNSDVPGVSVTDALNNLLNNSYLTEIYNPIYYRGKDIEWFGDSYTQGTGASTTDKRFSSIVSRALGANEINHGVAGTTMEKRAPIDYMASPNMVDNVVNIPTKTASKAMLVFAFGLNDMGQTAPAYTTENYKTDYQFVLDNAFSKGWLPNQILIIPAYYIGSAGYAAYAVITGNVAPTQARHLAFIQAAKEISETNGAMYFDIYADQVKNDITLLDPDGIHPNDAGYAYIANDVLNYLVQDKLIATNNTTWDLLPGYIQNLYKGNVLKNSLLYDTGSRIGLGITTPQATLHVSSLANTVDHRFTNSVTGYTNLDGTTLGVDLNGDFVINNYENKGVLIATNNTIIGYINNLGQFIFGGTSASNSVDKLQVIGSATAKTWIADDGSAGALFFGKNGATNLFVIGSDVALGGSINDVAYYSYSGKHRFYQNVQINTLAGTGTRQVVTDASGNLSATTTPVDSRPYKTYTVLITQTGTSDPTVTILENGIGAIIWTRTGVGTYSGTLTGAFTLNKTAQFIGNSNTCFVNLGSSGSNVVNISTYNAVGVISDGLLGSASYEIRVYN